MLRSLLIAAAAALLIAPDALAAPPANDAFANAQPLSGAPVTVNASNVDATVEPGESPPFEGGRTVWYAWTAPSTARYRIETCGSAFDTVLGVYTGDAVAALTLVAASDDACGVSSRVSVDAAAGTVYRIVVAGYGGDQGTFHLAIAQTQPPANDGFAAAAPLAATVPVTVSGTTRDASRETGEPWDHGDHSVWYTWTAPATGAYRIETCGSASEAAPAVYAGTSVSTLVRRSGYPWPCNGQPGASASARAGAGEPLRIAVGSGEFGSDGPFTLRITTEPVPANDAFAAAQPLSGPTWEVEGVAIAATSEPGEPAHGGQAPGRTVWFRWTPPATERYLFEIGGNVRVAMYTGGGLGALAPAPLSIDPDEPSFALLTVNGGTEYRIAVSWSENEPYPSGGRFYLAAYHAGLTATPGALQFAPQTVGTISAPSFVSLGTSPSGLVSLPLNTAVSGRDENDFVKSGDNCQSEAAACAVGIRFAPSAPGPRSAVLLIGTWLGTYAVPLSGTGAVPVVGSPGPAPQPPATMTAAPSAKATCKLRRRTVVRCTVTRTPAANGTVVGTLRRGSATRARGTVRMRAGKATVQLKSRRRLTRGRYRVTLSVSVPGQPKLSLARRVTVR